MSAGSHTDREDTAKSNKLATTVAVWALLSLCALVIGVSMLARASSLEGEPAPQFALPALDRHDVVRLDSMRGKVVLIDFWATWCPPCRKQMPVVQRLYDDAKLADQGVVVLSINVDDNDEARQGLVRRFMSRNKYTMTTLLDDGAASHAYRVSSIPTLAIIDAAGDIHHISNGVHEEAELRELLAEAAR
jgi:thiol-disulfide isomerase/thioredoxin